MRSAALLVVRTGTRLAVLELTVDVSKQRHFWSNYRYICPVQVLQMYAEVNMWCGDIVKVTPSSKAVGDIALFLVKHGIEPSDPWKCCVAVYLISY